MGQAAMLLLHPPVAKPCEPPGGIARLAGFLRGHGLPCTVADLNIEGMLFLLHRPTAPTGAWSRRACRGIIANLAALRSPQLYATPDRYRRAVADVNRVLALAGQNRRIGLSLANYQDPDLSPLKSADLIQAAAHPEASVFFPFFATRLPQLLEESQPALVGFSLNYLSQALCTFAMVGLLKQLYPGLPIVLGGGLVTSWLRNPGWRNPFAGLIDHLVAGPGEAVLLDLLDVKVAAQHQPADYTFLRDNSYLAPGFILPYAASAGCYWNQCSFCPEKAEDNPYVQVPAARALDDIHGLVASTRPTLLHLLDNAISPALMRALVARPPGVDWYGFARVSPLLMDTDFCQALRQSGCVMLKLGLESGDQGVLDAMRKGIDLTMVSETLAALKQAGIATYVYLLFGTPAESIDEARSTLQYVVDHKVAITFLNLAVFNMPICGAEADSMAKRDFYAADLSLYTDFEHPRGWDRQAVRRFLDQEFKRHPAVAAILRRDPPLFTSNHAPFFRK